MKRLVYIFFIFLLFSCSEDIDFNKKYSSPKLVLNGIFSGKEVPKISITESKSPASVADTFSMIKDAEAGIYEGGKLVSELNYYYGYEYKGDSTVNFKEGRTYTLMVKQKKYGTVTADFTFPGKIRIDSMRLKKESISVHDNSVEDFLVAYIYFKDPAGTDNYYQLSGYIREYGYVYNKRYNGAWDSSYYSFKMPFLRSYYQVDHILVNDNGDYFDDDDDYDDDGYLVFSDELFSGRSCVLKYVLYPYEMLDDDSYADDYGKKSIFYDVNVVLLSVSQDLYYYYKSVNLYKETGNDYMSEPVNIYNNIRNGLGIAGCYRSDTMTINYLSSE